MSFGKTVKLNDGNTLPVLGLGTWLAKKDGETKAAVKEAVRVGYRHLDLARIYQNQEEIGEAFDEIFAEGKVKREDLFIVSKLWNNAHRPDLVEAAYKDTLKQLHLDYLDLYLIHWPVAFTPKDDDVYSNENLMPKDPKDGNFVHLDNKTTLAQTWQALIDLQKAKKVKSIGVSNFTPSHIEGIIKATGVVPAVNQIESHPLLPQEDLTRYSKIRGIHLTAYSPLGNSSNYVGNDPEKAKLYDLVNSPDVKEVAQKLGVEPGQVLIAWGIQRGFSVIPKSVTPSRIAKNFEQIELSAEDYQKVTSRVKTVGHYKRFNIPWGYTPTWAINVFGEDAEIAATTFPNIGA